MENLDRKNACTPEENTGIDILLVGIEVSVGISDTFFSEGINVSFAVHPVSILIHGADDVVALTVVEIGFASYLNGAVSVCRWIVVILISVGVFDAVLVEGVRDSVGILPASVRHLAYIHAVSAAVIEITGSFGGSGLATAGGVSAIGRTVVCGSGGAVVSASCGSSSRTIVSAAGSSGRASGGCTAAGSGGSRPVVVPVVVPAVLEEVLVEPVLAVEGVWLLLLLAAVLVSDSLVFSVAFSLSSRWLSLSRTQTLWKQEWLSQTDLPGFFLSVCGSRLNSR